MRKFTFPLAGLLALVLCSACNDDPSRPFILDFDPPRPADVPVQLEPAFGGETFYQPLELIQSPLEEDRWYVVEKEGYIETFLASDPFGTRATAVDVSDFDDLHISGERGLLGMAFHPDFATNGEIYLSYVADTGIPFGDSVIARYESDDGGLTFTPHDDTVVLQLHQPASNHNGGDLAFGRDGMLYASFGDGGGAGDTHGNGQNLDTLHGSVIRIDVNMHPYGIPLDNPFFGDSDVDAQEIFAYGLRNPWRMSFDMLTGDLWLGDVGQASFEEVDLIVSGGNYGWPIKEAFACFSVPNFCDLIPGLIDPMAAHGRSEAQAISGGFVYRGDDIIGLDGAYVYGDHATGNIWALFGATGIAPQSLLLLGSSLNISGFGQARDGEIYVLDNTLRDSTQGGIPRPIQRLVPPPPMMGPAGG